MKQWMMDILTADYMILFPIGIDSHVRSDGVELQPLVSCYSQFQLNDICVTIFNVYTFIWDVQDSFKLTHNLHVTGNPNGNLGSKIQLQPIGTMFSNHISPRRLYENICSPLSNQQQDVGRYISHCMNSANCEWISLDLNRFQFTSIKIVSLV